LNNKTKRLGKEELKIQIKSEQALIDDTNRVDSLFGNVKNWKKISPFSEITIFDSILELLTQYHSYLVKVEKKKLELLAKVLKKLGFIELSIEVEKKFEIGEFHNESDSDNNGNNNNNNNNNNTKKNKKGLKKEHIVHDNISFQITHLSHKFRANSERDERVSNFNPDLWQRKLLDIVDKRYSFFVLI
jgi:hypothetical protein